MYTKLKNQCKLFYRFYKRTVCEMDAYWDLTMDDVRRIEQETQDFLGEKLLEFGLPSTG